MDKYRVMNHCRDRDKERKKEFDFHCENVYRLAVVGYRSVLCAMRSIFISLVSLPEKSGRVGRKSLL